ncbi:hypothetical protein IE81DRAFT_285961 [Ceraceosorus guamensis]|uniref:RRM domain-containing protein n=1 Tax=Ceraceosorus guamensis TaxID=1522189 RepID=A0A316WBB2_9BASI|nr:hypothetical protein IE81DRAFT_285961 [Ceraceosorus guamensis]PWN45223.1 hypothetical protein IE81DRAFT_285961 [Ceraceosorus guamensis]
MDGDEEEQDFEEAGAADEAGDALRSAAQIVVDAADDLHVAVSDSHERSALDTESDAPGEAEDAEVEAISHKEQRKRRKLEKAAAKAGTGGSADSVPVATEPKVPARSGFSLWIGNLSFRTSEARLKEWLEEGGITGISRIHMPSGQKKMEHNKGYAYADVPDADIVQAGIALSEGHLDGRRLLIKSGSDYTGRPALNPSAVALATTQPEGDAGDGNVKATSGSRGRTGLTKTAQKILRAQRNAPCETLFVGNLSFATTETSLRELVEGAAQARQERAPKESLAGDASDDAKAKADHDDASNESRADAEGVHTKEDTRKRKREQPARPNEVRGAGIRKIRMGEFEGTNKCKGFAFVDFHTVAHATATLISPRMRYLDGREIKLEYGSADAVRRGAVKNRNAAGAHEAGHRPHARAPHGFSRRKPQRDAENLYDGGAEPATAGPAPLPGSFDPEQPLARAHKPTKEEREARRAAQGHSKRRQAPGAALASAQREKIGIAADAVPQGKKIVF